MTRSVVTALGRGIGYIDLRFRGEPQVIATAVLDVPGGVALVDPGPSSCLEELRGSLRAHGAEVSDIQSILLTHIHLDHAGSTGSLVREHPGIRVFVHERGARHMIDPSRLLDSARRLYGTDMGRLWGEFLAVPAANVHALRGGEEITAGERCFEVACTPGHASHHVCYYDRASGMAFVGDTAGIRIGRSNYVMPPTPPPDIDLEAWERSLQVIHGWRPATLFVTHFGPHDGAAPHLETFREALAEFSRVVRESLDRPGTDEERIARFEAEVGRRLRQHLAPADGARYERAAPVDLCWLGLARYWRKRLGQ